MQTSKQAWPKMTRGKRSPGKRVRLDAAWRHWKAAVGSELWKHVTLLAGFCVPQGITPSEVDEGVLARFHAAELARGSTYASEACERIRRVSERLASERPKASRPMLDPPRHRATPRQDQWDGLPEPLRQGIEAWQARPGAPAASARTAERNLILRTLDAATRCGANVATLDDLISPETLGSVLEDPVFGKIDAASQQRSKFLEFGAAYAKWRRLPDAKVAVKRCLEMLPKRASPVRIEDIEAVEALADPAILSSIASHAEHLITTFQVRPCSRNHQAAQTAIAIRSVLRASFAREELMAAVFDGPERIAPGLRRPTLMIGSMAAEGTASQRSVELIDAYYGGCLRLGRAPIRLIERLDGAPRDATTLSEAVRRFGREIGLELTITRLVILSVALLIAAGGSGDDPVLELIVKQHLQIDQIANFRARYSSIFLQDVFSCFAQNTLDSER